MDKVERGFVGASLTAGALMGLCLLVLLVGTLAHGQTVTTQAEFERMRYPTRTMRVILPERLAKLDAAIHTPVANVTALAAIPAAERADGMLVGVKAGADSTPHGYQFVAAADAVADADLIVAPAAGTGRWYRLDGADSDTTYTAGPGLVLFEGEFSLPLTCGDGEVLVWTDDGGGDWQCEVQADTVYAAGSGLVLTDGSFHLPMTCAYGQVMTWTEDGDSEGVDGWACSDQTDTTYSTDAAGGIVDTAGVLTLLTTCTDNQILEYTSLGGWACAAAPSGSGTPDDGTVTPTKIAESDTGEISVPMVLFQTLTAGAGGNPDDVQIYAVDTLPFAFRVLKVEAVFEAGTGVGESVEIRTAAAGAGSLVVVADADAETFSEMDTGAPLVEPAVDAGLFARRSDDALAGAVMLTLIRVAESE